MTASCAIMRVGSSESNGSLSQRRRQGRGVLIESLIVSLSPGASALGLWVRSLIKMARVAGAGSTSWLSECT